MDPTNLVSTSDEQIEEFLLENNVVDVNPRAFNAVLKLYSNDEHQIMLTKEDFLRLFLFLESPNKVRHLLFPNTYTEEVDRIETLKTPDRIKAIHEELLKGMM